MRIAACRLQKFPNRVSSVQIHIPNRLFVAAVDCAFRLMAGFQFFLVASRTKIFPVVYPVLHFAMVKALAAEFADVMEIIFSVFSFLHPLN